VGEVEIPPHLQDFQARWKSPAFGLFLGAASSTARFTHKYCYRARNHTLFMNGGMCRLTGNAFNNKYVMMVAPGTPKIPK
jgi:hypothetical protein